MQSSLDTLFPLYLINTNCTKALFLLGDAPVISIAGKVIMLRTLYCNYGKLDAIPNFPEINYLCAGKIVIINNLSSQYIMELSGIVRLISISIYGK